MSPRPYRLGKRQAASEATRMRIIEAARELIMDTTGFSAFTIDAVAERAGVARMTVYYQFGSKPGLLEAIFDDLASRGLVERLPAIYAQTEPLDALAELISAFGHFWASDRLITRRLRALAALDPVVEQGIRARDERRRGHLRNVLGQVADRHGGRDQEFDETVDVLHTLTSFEFFDGLAAGNRGTEEVTKVVRRLARLVLGLEDAASDGR